jgi:2-oxoisovalerate dehydrogenase E2 component (dihydrolipoyl transacylase)
MAVVPFKLADIGEGIAEVELMQWFVKEGDTVKSFDRLCEVQSDKATVEITSRYGGTVVAVHHKEGDIVNVGSALVDIDTQDAGALAAAASQPAPAAAAAPTPAPAPAAAPCPLAAAPAAAAPTVVNSDGKVLTTPAVRKIGRENNVDLTLVAGTGPKGRILKEDMLKFVQNMQNPAPTPAATPARAASPASAEDVKVPIRGIQRMMVKSMTAAGQVPHLTFCEEIIMDNLMQVRADLKAIAKSKNIKLSYMPLIIKATALALREFPLLNATVNSDCTEVTHHGAVNMGVAMDTPKGLVVPVIRSANVKSVFEIAEELMALQVAASAGSLTEEQMSGGTFSLSNIGTIGGTYAVPILVVPQVAIGALGKFQVLPRYVNADKSAASNEDIYR